MKRLLCSILAWWLLIQPAYAVQFGAGTGTGYPSAVDTVNTRANKGGGTCSSATGSNICAEFTNDVQGAVAAIQTELGTLPKGSYADVKTRLNAGVYSGTAGLSSYVAGDLLYASNTTTLARLAGVATGNVLRAGGVGVAPAWGQVVLTTDVTGILPGANGGTGNGFFAVTGPASSLKTFTFPDASETIATLGQAETFSALKTFSAGLTVSGGNLIAPTILGGTGTTSTLTLQSTSGVGTTGADIIFKVGNNGATEAGRILNGAQWGIGGTPTTAALLQIGTDTTTAAGGLRFGTDVNLYRNAANGLRTDDDLTTGAILYANSAVATVKYYGSSGANYPLVFASRNTGTEWFRMEEGIFQFSGANGQKFVIGRATQLVTVGSGLSTKETTIQIPADAIVDVVSVRVKTKPGGTSTMTVTSTTSGDQFQKGASISTNAGTTDPGTKGTPRNYNSVAAQTVTLTFDVPTTDALGEIRVDLVYRTMTPATS